MIIMWSKNRFYYQMLELFEPKVRGENLWWISLVAQDDFSVLHSTIMLNTEYKRQVFCSKIDLLVICFFPILQCFSNLNIENVIKRKYKQKDNSQDSKGEKEKQERQGNLQT